MLCLDVCGPWEMPVFTCMFLERSGIFDCRGTECAMPTESGDDGSQCPKERYGSVRTQEPQATAEAGLSHAECADLLRGLKAGE